MPPKKQIKDDQTIKDVLKAHKEVYLQLCKQHLCSPIILKAFEESNRQMQLITKVCSFYPSHYKRLISQIVRWLIMNLVLLLDRFTNLPFSKLLT